MRILLTPQVNDITISYSFSGEIITATIGEVTDTFDFSGFPDGEINFNDIETILPSHPVIEAKRENGILSVQLLNCISEDATNEEKFPEWIEV